MTPLQTSIAEALSEPLSHHHLLMRNLEEEGSLSHLKRFTRDFAADPRMITDDQCAFLFERGFTPEKWSYYDFDKNKPDHYLSDVQRWLTQRINGEFAIVFNNKVLFTQVFKNFANVPAIVAIWRSGRVIVYDPIWERIKRGEAPEGLRYVAKPLGGGGGGSIYFIRVGRNNVVVECNDDEVEKRRTLPLAEIDRIFENARVPFIITEFIKQGEFTFKLFPLTVNTMRVLVIRDPETLQPHIVRAVQRIGTSESYPIDNFSYGGLSAAIDMDTGELGSAVAAAGAKANIHMDHHPDTGEPIAGRFVPGWHKIMEQVREFFLQMPYIQYCGFDLILRDDDFVVLEGNSFSQVRLFQMHAPLLTDRVYCKLLKKHGIYHGV
jgi:hypothetical protein